MIVNKSMFPLQTGFGVISSMQDRFAQLQMQLGTGMKAQTLSEMARELPVSLSARARLSTIEGFNATISSVNLRLSFYDNALSRFDKIEGEARNSAVPGQYGTNYINMATVPDLSRARLDEVVTMLRSDVAGRYLFGGKITDTPPLPPTDVLLDGEGGRAGFKTVVGERKSADAGLAGMGRTTVQNPANTSTVRLAEDGVHPFGFKLSTVSTTSNALTPLPVIQPGVAPLGDQVEFIFAPEPAEQIRSGETITLSLTLPDGSETAVTFKAVTAEQATGSPGEFVIGEDAVATAAAFAEALTGKLKELNDTELAAASTYAAAQNFFNGPGEPVLRVHGNPATATSLRVASPTDTVSWYTGQSPAVSATGLGRLDLGRTDNVVSLSERAPSSDKHGFQFLGATSSSASIATTFSATDPAQASMTFDGVAAGDTVTMTLALPDGTQKTVTMRAVTGRAGPGQFTIGTDADPARQSAQTAASFEASLRTAITEIAAAAEGNPRQSVSAAIEDSGRVDYGMQANESGYLRLVRSLSAMAITTYPVDADMDNPVNRQSRAIFDGMAARQQSELSEGHNNERGSIEIVTMELGVARQALQSASQRHTQYRTQLEGLLSDVETVSKEDVAMEIMALQTRLTASYQATSMVSKLSLVNYI